MDEIFDSSVTFRDLNLRDDVLQGIEAAGFSQPTHIQTRLIRSALQGRDILGQAKTGTGKTAAFALPLLHLADPEVPMQGLVLTPTRELAVQVAAEIEELGRFTNIRATCIIGGESMRQQSRAVKGGAHILVGTPGRVMDMQGRGQIHFNDVRFVVLDEVDRMLDIGFRDDIRRILKSTPTSRQTLFVSATISEEIERLARSFMKEDAEKIVTAAGSLTVSLVDQKYIPVEPWDKPQYLLYLLRHEKPDTTVVFCRTKATVHRLSKYLREHKINCREIHGDLMQKKRTRVMESLREGKLDVLVASDLAARGLDVEHISHVVNYDLPEDPEVYVHRIGRTARAGRRGIAWSFVTPEQGRLLTEIEKLTGVLLEKAEYPGFRPGPIPADVAAERARAGTRATSSLTDKMAERAAPAAAISEELTKEELEAMFPGGVVPKSPPRRTLGSRFRTKRR